jgi:hypothetical protein
MANILPSSYKHHLRTEYRLRFASVILFLLVVVLVVLLVLILPAYLIVQSDVRSAQSEVAVLASGDDESVPAADDGSDVIALVKRELAALGTRPQEEPSKLISAVINVTNSSAITLDRLNYEVASADAPGTLVVGGQAADRDNLIAFSQALEKLPQVAAVDLPVSQLASDSDIDFTITVTLPSTSSTTAKTAS